MNGRATRYSTHSPIICWLLASFLVFFLAVEGNFVTSRSLGCHMNSETFSVAIWTMNIFPFYQKSRKSHCFCIKINLIWKSNWLCSEYFLHLNTPWMFYYKHLNINLIVIWWNCLLLALLKGIKRNSLYVIIFIEIWFISYIGQKITVQQFKFLK